MKLENTKNTRETSTQNENGYDATVFVRKYVSLQAFLGMRLVHG